ncbi:MAG: transporter substrate-binding domain-containing protein, partial [Victivallaceae bacterium]
MRLTKIKTILSVIILLTVTGMCQLAFADSGNEFVTALTGKFPPFSYYNTQGELAGFDVDVSREIARRLKKQPRI